MTADRLADDVRRQSLPGHDRDNALAVLSQSRLRASSRIDEIQVAHLVAIGWRAGCASGLAYRPATLWGRLRWAFRREASS